MGDDVDHLLLDGVVRVVDAVVDHRVEAADVVAWDHLDEDAL